MKLKPNVIIYFLSLFIFSIANAQDWKIVDVSKIDTITIEILNQTLSFANGKVKEAGMFRHIRLHYGQITENYSPIGRHVYYWKNGKVKRVENYNRLGFMLSDTLFRRNGKMEMNRIFKSEYSILMSDGKQLNFVDRFYIITYYFKNGNVDCQGLAERTNSTLLIRRDTWKYYKKDGAFKYELKYKESGLELNSNSK